MITTALYAGSFDPITKGHLNIVEQALTMFDSVHIGVGRNPAKTGRFGHAYRVDLIKGAIAEAFPNDDHRIGVGAFDGGLAPYARSLSCTHIVRGLRQVSDFNDEFTLHGVLQRIAPDVPIVHLICKEQFLHVSSSTARALADLEEDLSWLVTDNVAQALAQFKNR